MSGKAMRGSRLEADIEKCREESNWKRVVDLALQNESPKYVSENLINFLIGEGKLELYLEKNPPSEANVLTAKNELADARKYLELCTNETSKKEEVAIDALLIMAKLEFACGNYTVALKLLHKAGLQDWTEKMLPTRLLRIVAESFAIEGICLEKTPLPYASKFKQVDREEKLTHCFEVAGNLALLYLQEQDKLALTPSSQSLPSIYATVNTTGSTSPLPPSTPEKSIGFILETALQKAPIVYMKAGQIDKAIARYRSILMAVESTATQDLRLNFTRQLAELLLRGASDSTYTIPTKKLGPEKSRSSASLKSGETAWKPKKYVATNQFLPQTINEEVMLLLLISEAMAVRETILSQSPEFSVARNVAANNATAVYDLLCISLAKKKQYQILVEVFERAMNFSFEAQHVWQQFGLSLACVGHDSRALLVLQEAHRLAPSQPHICLLAAKVCFQHLGKVNEGLEWVGGAMEAIELSSSPSILSARCHLYQGIGYMMNASHSHRHSESQSLRMKAYECFARGQQLDSADHLIEFYLAFHHAQLRQIVDAIRHVKIALYLRPEHPPSLLLLILLLTSQQELDEALLLSKAAVQEYPEHLQLLYVKASIEEEVDGVDTALHTAKHLLELWNTLYKHQIDLDPDDPQAHVNDAHSIFTMSEKDTVSVHAESVAASRVEAALSEVASSLSSYHPRPGPQQAWILQIQIWLLTAHLYLKADNQINEASQCIQEAASIFPMSYHIMFMRGQLHEKKNELHEALSSYLNTLSINPYHTKSLRHLARVYHSLGKDHLAEKTLLDAIRIDPLDHLSWAGLAEVTEDLGHLEVSAKAATRALDIHSLAPILPFSSIPFCFD